MYPINRIFVKSEQLFACIKTNLKSFVKQKNMKIYSCNCKF